MIQYKNIFVGFSLLLMIAGCNKKEYSLGDPIAPSEVMINTNIVGQTTANPNGDGSGDVEISLTGKNALAYRIDYDTSDGVNPVFLESGKTKRKYTKVGLNKYRITVVAFGPGATSTTVTKDISVQSTFIPDAAIVANLTGTGTKTWKIDKDVAAHLGGGPWSAASVTPEWYAAAPNEKAGSANCFYTAAFTFVKTATGYAITTATPDGALTKTGALAGGLPGIPASGNEGCYPYGGGTSAFSFVPASSGIATGTTKTAILLGGNNTFIGYGAVSKEYEIMSITATNMYLRVQGTETGNAWYLRLKAN